MPLFLTGEDLEKAICDVIVTAKESLVIVSPYIKLDDYFRDVFERKMDKPKLHLLLIFGKNENQYGKSLSLEDFEFFKKFSNVSIVFAKNLHGKYYGNEKMGVLTSINLYDYSFKNNVEFGVFSEVSILDRLKPSYDNDVFNYCNDLAEKYPAIFIKRPVVEKKLFGFSNNYLTSKVVWDRTDDLINNKPFEDRFIQDFDIEIDSESKNNEPVLSRKEFEESKIHYKANSSTLDQSLNQISEFGFCIRSGEKIPFNPEKPFTYKAFLSWSKFENIDFEEKYCHFSGEPSYGKTSMAKPVLRKNWSKSQEILNKLD